jgi:hypothetical protein
MATSIEEQIELLQSLKSYLEEFDEYIKQQGESYESCIIDIAQQGGLMKNPFYKIKRNSIIPLKQDLAALRKHINEVAIPMIEENIRYFESYEFEDGDEYEE